MQPSPPALVAAVDGVLLPDGARTERHGAAAGRLLVVAWGAVCRAPCDPYGRSKRMMRLPGGISARVLASVQSPVWGETFETLDVRDGNTC